MTQQCTFEKWSLAKFGCMPACQPEFSNGSATDLLHLRVLVTMVKIIFLSEKWYTCTSWKKNMWYKGTKQVFGHQMGIKTSHGG